MKTKIIASLGPSTESSSMLVQLEKAGVDIFRLNISHGDMSWHIDMINKIKKHTKAQVLIDTKGPELRTGKLTKNLDLKVGNIVRVTNQKDQKGILIEYHALLTSLHMGDIILINSGYIVLQVTRIYNDFLEAKVVRGGVLTSFRHVNIPHISLDLPILTGHDKQYLDALLDMEVDIIALSFTRTLEDITIMKEFLKKKNSNAWLISKIESLEGVENVQEILTQSYGIMVARGDLGTETSWHKIGVLEQDLLRKAHNKKKPVVVATQMLQSMVEHALPTRAEVMDISIAVQMGAKFVMLSDETAVGKFPIESVAAMKKIAEYAEKYPLFVA